jgi:hypothetical protein
MEPAVVISIYGDAQGEFRSEVPLENPQVQRILRAVSSEPYQQSDSIAPEANASLRQSEEPEFSATDLEEITSLLNELNAIGVRMTETLERCHHNVEVTLARHG